MPWRLDAHPVSDEPFFAIWDGARLEVSDETIQRRARRLLDGPLYPTPTSPPATDPDLRAMLALAAAAYERHGDGWAVGSELTGDPIPWPDSDLPDGATG